MSNDNQRQCTKSLGYLTIVQHMRQQITSNSTKQLQIGHMLVLQIQRVKQRIMMFDWNGLKDKKYFILTTVNDPLKYCNYALPFPSPIGLPFMPCDLPNQYQLASTDSDYQQNGDIYLIFQEKVPLALRILLPASHRPWQIIGKDYYQHVPYQGVRQTNCCFSSQDRPTVQVHYQQRFVGKVVQHTIWNCCCFVENFQQLQISDAKDRVIYRVISRNPQRGHKIILPWWGFDKIKYDIMRVQEQCQINIGQQQGTSLLREQKVGEIVHLFNGLSEYSSKNDRYGIEFPTSSNEEEKCLIVYCVLLIDYLLFCNF